MGLIEQKKQEKRQALLDAAYKLFLEQDASKVSINDITVQANVAKGTFYLYFKDKSELTHALLGRISYRVLSDAYEYVNRSGENLPLADKVIALADYIIEYLERETMVLRLLQRNFSWPTLQDLESESEVAPLVRRMVADLQDRPELAGRSEREIFHRISILVSMCASVCYSCIIEGKPDTIDNMKPVLYDIIRKSL